MSRYKLTLDYDGAPFSGWQRQVNRPSVQAALEGALAALDPSAPLVIGAGRTDAGVHATGQVAHADIAREWEPFQLTEAINWHLRPLPVAVLQADVVAPDFHARFDAIERRYLYRLALRRAPLTILAGRAWRVPSALDLGAMAEAAAMLEGRHDFTTFRSSKCQAASPLKTLDAITMETVGDEVHLRFRARSFLHNMVRSLVGTLVQVGAGRWPPARAGAALAARDRIACGPVAPPDGLYLTDVLYRD